MSYPPKNRENKADLPQSGLEIAAGSSEAGLKPEAVRECPENISIGDLRAFLFNMKDGLETDPAIARHLEARCPVCELRRIQLEATTPYLYGWLEPKFLATEELPPRAALTSTPLRPQPESNPVQTGPRGVPASAQSEGGAIAELCGKLASLIKAPTEPHKLEELENWNREIRLIEPEEEREEAARDLSARCHGRWRRLDRGLQELAKTAAEQLLTAVSGGAARFEPGAPLQPDEKHDPRRRPNDLAVPEVEGAFLDYMMQHLWFLNAGGDTVWGLSKDVSGGCHVVLYLDVLRQVLHPGQSLPIDQQTKPTGTTHENHV